MEREKRKVHVFRLELLEWQPPCFIMEIECGKGTYIRSLVHDLGQSLGCGAYLKNLIRLKSGSFTVGESLTIPQLKDSFRHGYWHNLLYPMDVVLEHWVAAIVDRDKEQQIRNGCPLALYGQVSIEESVCRAYSVDGCFLAMLRFFPERGLWQPEKVFSKTNDCPKASPPH